MWIELERKGKIKGWSIFVTTHVFMNVHVNLYPVVGQFLIKLKKGMADIYTYYFDH